jgi:hypothetical protein
MKYKQAIMQARTVFKEELTPKQFLAMKPDTRKLIAKTHISAPRLGSKSFGGLVVEYKSPIYKVG